MFLRAYQRLAQLQDPQRLGGWLRQITYSVCMNRLKHPGSTAPAPSPSSSEPPEPTDPGPNPEELAQAQELADIVVWSIAQQVPEARFPNVAG